MHFCAFAKCVTVKCISVDMLGTLHICRESAKMWNWFQTNDSRCIKYRNVKIVADIKLLTKAASTENFFLFSSFFVLDVEYKRILYSKSIHTKCNFQIVPVETKIIFQRKLVLTFFVSVYVPVFFFSASLFFSLLFDSNCTFKVNFGVYARMWPNFNLVSLQVRIEGNFDGQP